MSYVSYPEGDPRDCSLCNVRHLEKRIEKLRSALSVIVTSNAACDIEPHKLPVCYNDLVDMAKLALTTDK